MKRAAFIAVIISLLMSACKTQQQAVSVNNDDVYSTPSRKQSKSTQAPNVNQDLTAALAADQSAVATDSLKAKAATLDYSDVSYAARLNKFQHPQSNKTYWDNSGDTTYVNNSNPNVNINLGYGGGFYDWGSSFSLGFGWGYPYSGWGYPYYWDYPYWWYYYPYPYYGYPYWYYGYYPYGEGGYYNSYYGPRDNVIRNTDYTRNSRGGVTNATPASRGEGTVQGTPNGRSAPPSSVRSSPQTAPPVRTTDPVYTRTGTQPAPGVRSTDPVTTQRKPPASQERYQYTRPANERAGTYSRNTGQVNANRETRQQQPAPRYTQPGSTPVQRQGSVQNYTPGNYRQARSSQEYISPRIQAQNSATRPATTSGSRGGSSVQQRGYSSPGNTSGTRNQQYSSPRNYSPGYSSPSRSYSPGYSSPGGSRSGGGSSVGGGGGGRSGGGGGSSGGHSGGGGGGGGSPRK